MKHLIIGLIFSFSCNAQQPNLLEKSIGVVMLGSITKNDKISLYNLDGTKWYEFNIYSGINDSFKVQKSFRPYNYDMDYFNIAFLCIEKNKNKFTVVINDEKKIFKDIIINDSVLVFKTWDQYVLSHSSIGFESNKNKIRVEPNDKAQIIEFLGNFKCKPLEIKNEWLKISWKPEGKIEDEFGWIKWKEENKLIVYFFKD